MICLSSAGSLASFDGGSKTQASARAHLCRRARGTQTLGTAARRLESGGRGKGVRSGQRQSENATGGPIEHKATSTPAMATNATPTRTQILGQARAQGSDMLRERARTDRRNAAADSGAQALAGARRGGWRRHSKRHASRRNLKAAICVQKFDDSLNSAIRTTYRISLRSSSLREPRYPSAGVVCGVHTTRERQPGPLGRGRRSGAHPKKGEAHADAHGKGVVSTRNRAPTHSHGKTRGPSIGRTEPRKGSRPTEGNAQFKETVRSGGGGRDR